mmetsp:Transcript_722/g.2434  ORF Transcript_722/g.2434 Transcript_722/m.2434 type:complete len:329 (-) Transcript_722:6098-7084(-)
MCSVKSVESPTSTVMEMASTAPRRQPQRWNSASMVATMPTRLKRVRAATERLPVNTTTATTQHTALTSRATLVDRTASISVVMRTQMSHVCVIRPTEAGAVGRILSMYSSQRSNWSLASSLGVSWSSFDDTRKRIHLILGQVSMVKPTSVRYLEPTEVRRKAREASLKRLGAMGQLPLLAKGSEGFKVMKALRSFMKQRSGPSTNSFSSRIDWHRPSMYSWVALAVMSKLSSKMASPMSTAKGSTAFSSSRSKPLTPNMSTIDTTLVRGGASAISPPGSGTCSTFRKNPSWSASSSARVAPSSGCSAASTERYPRFLSRSSMLFCAGT